MGYRAQIADRRVGTLLSQPFVTVVDFPDVFVRRFEVRVRSRLRDRLQPCAEWRLGERGIELADVGVPRRIDEGPHRRGLNRVRLVDAVDDFRNLASLDSEGLIGERQLRGEAERVSSGDRCLPGQQLVEGSGVTVCGRHREPHGLAAVDRHHDVRLVLAAAAHGKHREGLNRQPRQAPGRADHRAQADDERLRGALRQAQQFGIVLLEGPIDLLLEPLPVVVGIVARLTCEDEALECGDDTGPSGRLGGGRGHPGNREGEGGEQGRDPAHRSIRGKSRAARGPRAAEVFLRSCSSGHYESRFLRTNPARLRASAFAKGYGGQVGAASPRTSRRRPPTSRPAD